MKFNTGIIDVHVHAHGGCMVDGFLRNALDHVSAAGIDKENLLCVKHGRSACQTEAVALLAKVLYPDKFSVLGNPTFMIPEFGIDAEGAAAQVQDFIDAGIDGVKMADANADGRPLDHEIFDPMFSVLEKTGAPIIYHIGTYAYQPYRHTFVKNHNAVENPPFLTYQAGVDDDRPESFNEEIQRQNLIKFAQLENILTKHPDLHFIAPHMLCHADDLDDLARIMDAHKNLCIDITPCDQIYYYFSQDTARARDFIGTYKDRILFGTDNTIELDPFYTIALMRAFLETDEKIFSVNWGFDLKGIALPKDVLSLIYRENYNRLFKNEAVNKEKAAAYCDKLYDIISKLTETPKDNLEEVRECAKRIRA